MIADNNLLILAARPDFPGLRRWIDTHVPHVSAISQIEVLGYFNIQPPEKSLLEAIFTKLTVLAISAAVVSRAITLRQSRKMSLGDAIIAATALEFGHELYTHNSKDFTHVPGLVVTDPIASGDPP